MGDDIGLAFAEILFEPFIDGGDLQLAVPADGDPARMVDIVAGGLCQVFFQRGNFPCAWLQIWAAIRGAINRIMRAWLAPVLAQNLMLDVVQRDFRAIGGQEDFLPRAKQRSTMY